MLPIRSLLTTASCLSSFMENHEIKSLKFDKIKLSMPSKIRSSYKRSTHSWGNFKKNKIKSYKLTFPIQDLFLVRAILCKKSMALLVLAKNILKITSISMRKFSSMLTRGLMDTPSICIWNVPSLHTFSTLKRNFDDADAGSVAEIIPGGIVSMEPIFMCTFGEEKPNDTETAGELSAETSATSSCDTLATETNKITKVGCCNTEDTAVVETEKLGIFDEAIHIANEVETKSTDGLEPSDIQAAGDDYDGGIGRDYYEVILNGLHTEYPTRKRELYTIMEEDEDQEDRGPEEEEKWDNETIVNSPETSPKKGVEQLFCHTKSAILWCDMDSDSDSEGIANVSAQGIITARRNKSTPSEIPKIYKHKRKHKKLKKTKKSNRESNKNV